MKVAKSLILLNWILLFISFVGWPLSALTFAKKEPQTVLALSWGAIMISALTALLASYVHKDQKQIEEDKEA